MDLRDEGGEEFLYVTSYRPKMFAKLSLKGEEVWRRHAPMESGKYAAGEDVDNHVYGERDNFMPTNFAFLPDGDFLVADGYGSFWIHRYDKDANWKSCFGGPGEGDATFINPHGLWYDNRPGREPAVVDHRPRPPHRQILHARGQIPLARVEGFLLPCHFDLHGDVMLVPDLSSRVTLLDKDNKPLAHLANYPDWQKQVDEKKLRTQARHLGSRQIRPPARRLLRQRRQHHRHRMGRTRPRHEAHAAELAVAAERIPAQKTPAKLAPRIPTISGAVRAAPAPFGSRPKTLELR